VYIYISTQVYLLAIWHHASCAIWILLDELCHLPETLTAWF